MPSLPRLSTLFLLVTVFSTAHNFLSYKPMVNHAARALTATGFGFSTLSSNGGVNVSSLLGTAAHSSVVNFSTASTETLSTSRKATKSISTQNSITTGALTATDTPTPRQSNVSNSSSLISITAIPGNSTSSENFGISITSPTKTTDGLTVSSGGLASTATGTTLVPSRTSPKISDHTTKAPSSTSIPAAMVPSTIKATDGSDRSTIVTWSVVRTGSTSTTDNIGHPTVIPAPFYACDSPLCTHTGCIIAILCSPKGGAAGFEGFPPPNPPPNPPPDIGGDSPSDSASQKSGSRTKSRSLSSSSTTTSSSFSSTSSNTCAPITTVADPGPTSAGDPDDGSRRRVRRYLESRTLTPRDTDKIGTCELRSPVKIPLFSSYSAAMNLDKQPKANGGANGRVYNTIEKWYAESLNTNGAPFLGAKLDKPFNGITGPGSIDHVWEKSNVADFLASLLGSDFDCDDLNSLFSSCGIDMQKIFDQLPSMAPNNVQPGFAAMNRNLNGMKGWMFSQGFSTTRFSQIYNSDDKVIQALERQAIIFNWFNSDGGIQSMHDATNNRIYGAFLALDESISKDNIQRANGRGDLKQRFGPTFKTWYGQLLDKTGSASFKWASDQVTRLEAKQSLSDCLRRALNVFQSSPLYGKDKFKIDQSHLSWTPTSVQLKRSLFAERDDQCAVSPIPSPSTSPTSAPSTASRGSTISPSSILPTTKTPLRSISKPLSSVSHRSTLPSLSTASPPVSSGSFECTNPSPEDGDGFCTCSIGSSVVGTYTPSGTGADWGCPSSPPSTTHASPVSTSLTSSSPSSCSVPDGCTNATAPTGCAVLCS